MTENTAFTTCTMALTIFSPALTLFTGTALVYHRLTCFLDVFLFNLPLLVIFTVYTVTYFLVANQAHF
jgi:hypothetical protein